MPDLERPRLGGRRRSGEDGEVCVFCADEQNAVEVDLGRWQALATAVLAAEGVRGLAELSVLFISEEEIAALNAEHMGKDGPTDVLSFPIDGVGEAEFDDSARLRGPDRSPSDMGEMPLLLGDIVICPGVAARQAPDHAGTLDDELALLVVHGVLHILGHDHAEEGQAVAMRTRERALLEAHHWHGVAPTGFRQVHADEQPGSG